jgi:hypothetical protein
MITHTKMGYQGQLGNQLFQYAMLLGVSEKTGYRIVIPKRFTNFRKKRGLVELRPFKLKASGISRIQTRLKIFQEHNFVFYPEVFEQPDNIDYRGYYQNERYFSHVEQKIRSEFRMNGTFEVDASQYIYKIRETSCVVAVHVRRGDYLNDPDTFHVLPEGYYERAMNHPSLPEDRQYLIFSDDMDWCKPRIGEMTNKKVDFAHFPSHWHDLAAMTYCDAHVISGSTFSWWGAYLCHNRPNPVIAPDPWFPVRSRFKNEGIVPERWHRLGVYE